MRFDLPALVPISLVSYADPVAFRGQNGGICILMSQWRTGFRLSRCYIVVADLLGMGFGERRDCMPWISLLMLVARKWLDKLRE